MEDNPSTLKQKLTKRVLDGMGYLVPLFQSIPFGYAGLMVMPFLVLLVGVAVTAPVGLLTLPFFLIYLIFGGFPLEILLALVGFSLWTYSIAYLRTNRELGLVRMGPYRFVRHPQYLGVLLFTLTLTTRSIWLGTWANAESYWAGEVTILVWYAELFAYVLLAVAEEQYLLGTQKEGYAEYIQRTGFLLPSPVRERRWVDILFSVIVLLFLLHGTLLLYQNTLRWPFQPFS